MSVSPTTRYLLHHPPQEYFVDWHEGQYRSFLPHVVTPEVSKKVKTGRIAPECKWADAASAHGPRPGIVIMSFGAFIAGALMPSLQSGTAAVAAAAGAASAKAGRDFVAVESEWRAQLRRILDLPSIIR